MSSTLVVTETTLDKHFGSLAEIVRNNVCDGVRPKIIPNPNATPLSARLAGSDCEIVSRNRRNNAYVAPLVKFRDGVLAWLGFHQEWAKERLSGRTIMYSYRSTALSVHLGLRNIPYKPQIFRAEWAGWAAWDGQDHGAQAGNAAHPHWQFDVIESLRKQQTGTAGSTYSAVLEQEAEGETQTFSPNAVQPSDIDELVWSRNFSRIHFASAASWWKTAPDDRHAHFPVSVTDVEAWVQKTIEYTVEELKRLN